MYSLGFRVWYLHACMIQLDSRGRIVTAEISFAQKGAAAVAAKTFHGVSVHNKRGRQKFTLKVAVVDHTQQPGAVEQIEEDDIPSKAPYVCL